MTSDDLESVALTLVAKGKGILAADETVPTSTRRFDTLGIQSTLILETIPPPRGTRSLS